MRECSKKLCKLVRGRKAKRRKTSGREIRPRCVWENRVIVRNITQTRLY
jgi:hypothetical protein